MKTIFKLIWRSYLKDYRLIKITGWRSCLADRVGQRYNMSFCFWIFNQEKEMTDLEFYTNWYLEDADHGYWIWPEEVKK